MHSESANVSELIKFNQLCMKQRFLRLAPLVALVALSSFSVGFAGGTNFSDVGDDAVWYVESLKRMENLGIIQGYGDNTFRGSNSLSRAETVIILDRFMNQVLGPVVAGTACSASYFNPEDTGMFVPGETFTVLDTYMCEDGEWVVVEQ